MKLSDKDMAVANIYFKYGIHQPKWRCMNSH